MKRFAVIGNPIEQSKSPIIHQTFAKQFNIELEYQKILSTSDEFNQTISDFFQTAQGMNVTAPFKELAYQAADELTERATLSQAVNTLYIEEGKLKGDTTDGAGLVNDLKFHDVELKGKRVLLLGAGGAAKGCVKSLLDEAPDTLTIANRTVSKAEHIQSQYKDGAVQVCQFDQLGDDYDVVINSTSCSLTYDVLDIPAHTVANAMVVYDMSYKNETTSFNQWAQSNSNAKTIDGLGMLVEQAAESFRIWHGVMPDTSEIRKVLRTA